MNTFTQIVEQVREHGERLTPQRRMVIQALCESAEHMTIHDIWQTTHAYDPTAPIPEPTIYRIVQWLKDLGIVSQTDLAGSGVVYQLVSTPPHHHLICLKCNRMINFDDQLFASLRQELLKQHQFQARIEHMAIYGWCADCRNP